MSSQSEAKTLINCQSQSRDKVKHQLEFYNFIRNLMGKTASRLAWAWGGACIFQRGQRKQICRLHELYAVSHLSWIDLVVSVQAVMCSCSSQRLQLFSGSRHMFSMRTKR